MKNLLFLLTILLIPSVASSQKILTEHEVRNSIMNKAREHLVSQNFGALEELVEKYSNSNARTPSGVWKIGFIYAGITEISGNSKIPNEDQYWGFHDDRYTSWIEEYPQSATAQIYYAKILLRKAWYYRGAGYANTVDKQQWALFYKFLNQASNHLDNFKDRSSKDPNWYEAKLEVAKGLGVDDDIYNNILDEALDLHPYYYPIYFSAINRFAPRWHGSLEMMESFAARSVELTRETEGVGMYARVYWYVSQSLYGDQLFTKSLISWDKMSQGIDDVLAKYPDQWNINNFAKFSCLARDKNKTRSLIMKISGEPLRNVWGDRDMFNFCKNWSLE